MNNRSHFTMTCLFALGALFPILVLRAEVPNQSVENLKKNASHIVVGKVTKISHETTTFENYEDIKGTAEISVTAVEKGDGIAVGDVIKVRYWNSPWFGKEGPPPRSSGHRGVPKWYKTTRVYLNLAKGGGYDVILPNGFQPVEPEPKPVKPDAKPVKPEAK